MLHGSCGGSQSKGYAPDRLRMPRFFAEITHFPIAAIKGKTSVHHITGPLRKRIGDEISIRDESKGYQARISSIRTDEIILEILRTEDLSDRSIAHVHLAICLVDFKDMEDIIRYATELGVADICPIIADRSNIRSISDARHKRWRAIVLEAVKQCERKTLPNLHRAEPLDEFIHGACRQWGGRLVALQGADHPISEYRMPDVGVLIGPEGGFSPEELDMITLAAFIPVSLGNTTLRAVTAAITAAAILGF
jgi:16S rRNA (uracil1498-N3)-methyltransferase